MTTVVTSSKGGSRALRLAAGLLLAAAAAIVAACGYEAVARIGQPFAGFFVWENRFVPAVGLPSWSGAASGLEYHSWIEAVEGRHLSSVGDLDAVVAAKPLGGSIAYTVTRGNASRQVEVPTETFSLAHFAVSTGVFLFDSVVLLLLAATMLYVGAGDAGARAVAFFALAQSLYLATSIDLFGPYRFREMYFFFAGLTPTATLFMISRFPVERRRPRWEDPVLALALSASLAFGVLSNAWFEGDRDGLLTLDRLVHFSMAASALAAFAFFTRHFLRARSEAVRRRCQVVLLASLGGFLPTMVFLLAFYAGGVSLPFNFLAVPFVLFPLGIGYAVGKHDLFDVDTIVKRTIVYATLSGAVFAAYSVAINAFDLAFENATPVASRLAEGAVIVTLLVLFDPSRRRLQETVNRLYDRRRWVYRDVVRSAVRAFSTILDLEHLVPSVLGLVDDSVQPVFARIYSIEVGGSPRLRGELVHPPGEQAAIRTVDGVHEDPALASLAVAAAVREVVTMGDVDQAGGADQAAGGRTAIRVAASQLAAVGGEVALGLALEGKPTGLLIVGPRRAGGLYTREDLDLLRTIAGQLAVAMQNAESYRTIDTLNRDLAGKNIALEHALGELRETQDELVIKERLAAVGELAGAVAHTIRNPLAGMRATAQQASIELADHPVTELVDAFVRETDRLSARIDALLNFSRPFHVAAKPDSLADVARRAAQQVVGRARQRGVTIDESGIEREAPALVDPDLFEQLTVELIANAVDASPSGGCVHLAAGRRDGASFLEVRDEGEGIRDDQRERMFRMFFTTKAKGTGIGLATVKKIADAHGATIEADNHPEGGARFRVSMR